MHLPGSSSSADAHINASSVSGGSFRNGRELTAAEEVLFQRRRRQGTLATVVAGAFILAGALGLSHLAQKPAVSVRTWAYGSGQAHIVAEYVGPKKNGHYVEYHQNGNKKAEGFYRNESQDGVWSTYYWGGLLESQGEMRRGLRVGPWEFFHPNGQKKAVEAYVDGVAEGHWVTWHENGQIATDATYVRGLAEGLERTWYENGQLESEGSFINGYAEGEHKTYHEDGSLYQARRFDHGVIVNAEPAENGSDGDVAASPRAGQPGVPTSDGGLDSLGGLGPFGAGEGAS